jgi:hypothetical protein
MIAPVAVLIVQVVVLVAALGVFAVAAPVVVVVVVYALSTHVFSFLFVILALGGNRFKLCTLLVTSWHTRPILFSSYDTRQTTQKQETEPAVSKSCCIRCDSVPLSLNLD